MAAPSKQCLVKTFGGDDEDVTTDVIPSKHAKLSSVQVASTTQLDITNEPEYERADDTTRRAVDNSAELLQIQEHAMMEQSYQSQEGDTSEQAYTHHEQHITEHSYPPQDSNLGEHNYTSIDNEPPFVLEFSMAEAAAHQAPQVVYYPQSDIGSGTLDLQPHNQLDMYEQNNAALLLHQARSLPPHSYIDAAGNCRSSEVQDGRDQVNEMNMFRQVLPNSDYTPNAPGHMTESSVPTYMDGNTAHQPAPAQSVYLQSSAAYVDGSLQDLASVATRDMSSNPSLISLLPAPITSHQSINYGHGDAGHPTNEMPSSLENIAVYATPQPVNSITEQGYLNNQPSSEMQAHMRDVPMLHDNRADPRVLQTSSYPQILPVQGLNTEIHNPPQVAKENLEAETHFRVINTQLQLPIRRFNT